jgi:hypothetical protein
MTSCANLRIVRGNNYPPLQWQILVSKEPDVLMDLTGSAFYLAIFGPGIDLDVSTLDELQVDLGQSIVKWSYTVAQSRLFPLGRQTSYELERRIGTTQQVLAVGQIRATDGLNPD